jgi:hypothetical protein
MAGKFTLSRVVKLFLTYFRSNWRAIEPIDKEFVLPICVVQELQLIYV